MPSSAVEFANQRRIHIGLAVTDIDRSTRFYETLFHTRPSKTREGYARFEVIEPPVNLSLMQTSQATGPADPTSHFGIQVKSTEVVGEMAQRLADAGLRTRIEESTLCCHAVQDKVWALDPDGQRWEIFVVLNDNPGNESTSESRRSESEACCPTAMAEPCCHSSSEPCCVEESNHDSA